MRTIFIILLLALFNNLGFSQTKTSINDVHNVYDEKGDFYYNKKDYKKAIVYYNMAYQLDAKNYYSVLRKAEAFASLGLLDQAAECYNIIFETSLDIPNNYRLQYALLLLKKKDIKGFDTWMWKYNEIVTIETGDKFYLSSSEVRNKMYKDSSIVEVENESFLNTSESEICPVIYQNKVIFASNRKNLTGSAGNSVYNLFSASYLDGGQLGKLNMFNISLRSNQNINSLTISDQTKSIYFTRSTTANSNLKSFVANIPLNVNDKLDVREFKIEGFSGNIGQINFNSSGTKLFFVSDVSGGSGGLDIYSSELIGGKWSKPQNLGTTINSAKDELYPFILNDTILYFSSAGHNSLGGLDLFSVNLKSKDKAPKNLGNKVNSTFDDYSLSFSPGGITGYFCSNRPGGLGKEDIYRLHLMDIKVKLPAYQFKRKFSVESDKINLYTSDGQDYNIASKDKSGFTFEFQPGEAYKMIVQHENPVANDIISNTNLTADQRKKLMLAPQPLEKTEIRLETGMRYQFTAGMKPIGSDYKTALNDMAKEYQNSGNSSTIDLTALAKELLLTEGEIYTIRFVKDDKQVSKVKGESSLFVNDQTVAITGNTFFFVLPLDIQVNFNIQTDIAHFKETFNPKKVGAVKVDATPVYNNEPVVQKEGFPILVNTQAFSEASRKISASELTIVPGTMYILSVRKTDAASKEPDLVVPLTKGVKYNLGTENESLSDYNKQLSQVAASSAKSNSDAELIDISILSKELDLSEENIVFSLEPAKQIASQAAAENVLTTLDVDGRKFFVTNKQKLQVNLKLEQNKSINIQTDLKYVKENFDPTTIAVKIDTTSFSKSMIKDPVFDLIIVNFNLNEYTILPAAKSIIDTKVVQTLKSDSRLYVTITGYTDPLGNDAYNQILSRNRAQAVKDYLAKNGIGDNRIRTFSFGETQALKEGQRWEDLSETELAKYRKVEIVIYLPKDK